MALHLCRDSIGLGCRSMDNEFKDLEPDIRLDNFIGKSDTQEMIRITPEGFWVRGVKVPADEHEAQAVYNAFKRWLVESEMRRSF